MVLYLLTDERLFVVISYFFRKVDLCKTVCGDNEYWGIDNQYRYSIDSEKAIELSDALNNPFSRCYNKSFDEIERLEIFEFHKHNADADIIKKILPAFPNLKELKIHSAGLPDLKFLTAVPNLESLIIRWNLCIQYERLDFFDISGIENCQKLKHIWFDHIGEEMKNTELLKSLPELSCLRIIVCSFDLSFIRELTNLKELYMSGLDMKMYTLKNLDTLTKLKILCVYNIRGLYTKFKKLESLEYLFIGGTVISYKTKLGFKGIEKIKNLKQMIINERDIANPQKAEKYKHIINNPDVEWPRPGELKE